MVLVRLAQGEQLMLFLFAFMEKIRGDELLNDYKPILFTTPLEQETAEIYFIHDLHKGSAEHDAKKVG